MGRDPTCEREGQSQFSGKGGHLSVPWTMSGPSYVSKSVSTGELCN